MNFSLYANMADFCSDSHIYTQSPSAAGPRVKGVYIRLTMSTHGITTM